MPLSLYDISIPVFIRGFGNLSRNLDKGRAFADERGVAHSQLLEARLFEDMTPLTAQIQRASDTARFAATRVGLVEAAGMPDEETSFDDLQERIRATVAYLKTVPADSMDGREAAEVVVTTRAGSVSFTAKDYLLDFALPNFFFHATTAYDILRHKGVPLGKMDFLGPR
ncbi:DUF1993 domain-containing protein [Mesorhizobium sp. CAU 1732]|uniref:DUF1993 domain-containing protein n=1 Tax=Mesorhizobium sp. CAU 1732 TaxID=3140358 RepID=UPI0032613402